MRIITNTGDDRVVDALMPRLGPGTSVSVASPRLSILTFGALRQQLAALAACRLILPTSIHRAIPYPVLLLSDDGDAVTLSLAHKRWAQNEAGKVVIEEVVATPPLKDLTGVTEQLFLASLPVAKQPSRDLLALYEGWRSRIEALNAAQIVGAFITSDDPRVVERRRRALDEYARLTKEETQLRAQAARAKQMNQRVELNQRIKSIRDDLARHKVLLSGGAA